MEMLVLILKWNVQNNDFSRYQHEVCVTRLRILAQTKTMEMLVLILMVVERDHICFLKQQRQGIDVKSCFVQTNPCSGKSDGTAIIHGVLLIVKVESANKQ